MFSKCFSLSGNLSFGPSFYPVPPLNAIFLNFLFNKKLKIFITFSRLLISIQLFLKEESLIDAKKLLNDLLYSNLRNSLIPHAHENNKNCKEKEGII